MKKILISMLGRGQFFENRYDYKLVKYEIDGRIKETKLVGDFLKDIINSDEVYVVGTDKSLWNVADEYIKDYQKIIIPYGTNIEEFWEIFRIFSSLDVNNSEVYFDMTHGFRSIPFFVSTILNFFKLQKNVKIKGVYYGVFESKKDDVTPIINMLPFIELNEWIEAANIFVNYSDGRKIKNLIDIKYSELANSIQDKSNLFKYKEIKNIANELEVYTQNVGFAAVENYLKSLNKIDEKIEKISEYPAGFEAFNFIVNLLDKEADYFRDLKKKWGKFLKVSEIFFHKNRYAQSLTILRETLHYYIYENLNLSMNIKKFDEKISLVIKNDIGKFNYFTKEFLDNVDRVKKLRNITNHAFLGEEISDKKMKKIVSELFELIKDTQNILSDEKKVFKNTQLLINSLKEDE